MEKPRLEKQEALRILNEHFAERIKIQGEVVFKDQLSYAVNSYLKEESRFVQYELTYLFECAYGRNYK